MDTNLQKSVQNSPIPQSPTNNLDVSAATYLGGAEDDFTNAVDISADGKFVIVGGSLKNANLGGTDTQVLGGGDGTLIRYNSQTNQVVSTTRLPGKVVDLEISKNGDIAVAYEGGIAVLNSDATQVKWSKSLNDVFRIAISDSGKVAAIEDINADKAYLFDSNGQQLQQWTTSSDSNHFYDIAVTDQEGGMVIATGYKQKTSVLQVAFTQAWSYGGQNLWKNYDFNASDIQSENIMADTRGVRVAIGSDGKLYASYKINGGTGSSILSRDPNNLSETLADDRKIETDNYNRATNVGSINMAWYGRYDPKTGELIKGQSLLSRLSSGKGNSVEVESITATQDGTVILAGSTGARIANRDSQTIEGQTVNGYAGFEGYIAIVSPDLEERISWTPITDGKGAVAASRNGKAAVVTTTDFEGNQITHNAVQSNRGGKNDGYLLVIGGNDVPPGTEPTTDVDNPTQPGGTEVENPTQPGGTGTDNPTQPDGTEVENPTQPGGTGTDNPTQPGGTEVENPTQPDGTGTDNPTQPGGTEVENSTQPGGTGTDNPTQPDGTEVENPTQPGGTGTDNPTQPNETEVENLTQPGGTGVNNPTQPDGTGTDNPTQPNGTEVENLTQPGGTGVNNPTQPGGTEVENPTQPGGTGVNNPTQPDGTDGNNSTQPGGTEVENPTQPGGTGGNNSVLPAGLIDLTNIDLNGDNQVDEKVNVNFFDIKSDAAYNNSMGYYAISNMNGAVKDALTGELINPEDEGYAKAALQQRVEDLQLRRNNQALTDELNSGIMLVPFLIANGTVEEWMEQNSNNQQGNDNLPIAYFSFVNANPDNKQHIRKVGNELQFEDLFNGGDNDFNDFAVKTNIESAV